MTIVVVGGGAAGIFAAIWAKTNSPNANVILLEKTATLLAKVRVSGGGRCNVTHHCFEPKELVKNYPRGNKELLGPFHTFGPSDTVKWFEERGVELKVEKDGRMFPTTDNSQTIIDCLLKEAKKLGVEIRLKSRIGKIAKEGSQFHIDDLTCDKLILATGSSKAGHEFAQSLGHTIEKPLPSLFTFNVPTSPLKELSGISCQDCEITLNGTSLKQRGPLLITHFGFSGPAILKLSAWAAPFLFENTYKTPVTINWLPNYSQQELTDKLLKLKKSTTKSQLSPIELSKNLWRTLIEPYTTTRLCDIPDKALRQLAEKLHADTYQIDGKTTHKEEFVTCGGVKRSEINFKTMESKVCPNLHFAGEVIDIDGVTGGFNFQNAWTTAFLGSH